MDYAQFSSADFICDEFFQRWIIQPDNETDEFWSDWLTQHPDRSETVDEAKELLLQIRFKEEFPSDEQVKNSLASTLSKINGSVETSRSKNKGLTRIFRLKQIIKIAAVFIIVSAAACIILYNYWTARTIISSEYGEIKKVTLPDGSSVVLNAHSTISFYKHVLERRPRQVWLEGEAFFDVRHINVNQDNIKEFERFIVSTIDLNVNVLGTSFNIKKRTKVTEVILKTGKIRIEFNDKLQQPVTMSPGQMVAYNNSNKPFIKSVDPSMYTTWIDKKLILKEASINEITQYIQDYYGYTVILQDTSIGKRKMEGALLLDDLQDVLFVLSSTLNIEIEKQGDSLIFKKRR